MVHAHWTILQMHSDFAKVRKHKPMDIMKSTQWVMEKTHYQCPAILCSSGQSMLHFCRIFEHVKFLMVNAHWTILQMHVHLQYDSTVKKHHQMDMMKSTQRAMERSNYHCPAIPSSSGQSILHFCRIFEYVKFLMAFGPQKSDYLLWLLASYEIILQMDKSYSLCTSNKKNDDNKIWLKYVDTVLLHVNWHKIWTVQKALF
jgi:hypothetical protein